MTTNNTLGPANPSAMSLRMQPMWALVDALLGGTETMRMAGKTFLSQHTGEEDSRYVDRLAASTLWNQLELTLGGWVGRPFRDPLKLNDDIPKEIVALSQDIDQQGTNMDTFARKWFRSGVSKAFCHVLVEQPEVRQREDGKNLSVADAAKQNIRPYWCLIEPDAVIAAKVKIIDGVEMLTHLRFFESTMEVDPEDQYSEVVVERIREYNRTAEGEVLVNVFRKAEPTQTNQTTAWDVEKPPTKIDIDVIPLVTFYADRQGFMLGKSPLQDLADLNLRHWNSQSDQDNILTIARFPILAGSGVEQVDGSDPTSSDPQAGKSFTGAKGAVIGPWNVLLSSEPGSKFYYVEHSGKAIAAGQASLDKLEAKMAAYGSEFLKKSPDRQTATARTLDSLESISPLQAVTLDFIDAFQTALVLTAKWLGLPPNEDARNSAGSVMLVTDFGPEDASGVDITALQAARTGRDISRTQYLKELKRRGILEDEYDAEADKKELQKEALDLEQTQLPTAGTNLDGSDEEEGKKNDGDDREE